MEDQVSRLSPLVSLRESQVMIESVEGYSMNTQYMKAQKSLNQGLMNTAKLM